MIDFCGPVTYHFYHHSYIPWNMHEPIPGEYDFSGMLDVRLVAKCHGNQLM